jgi:hypothetical protein
MKMIGLRAGLGCSRRQGPKLKASMRNPGRIWWRVGKARLRQSKRITMVQKQNRMMRIRCS